MRAASVIAFCLAPACLGCTYDVPSLEYVDGSAGGEGSVISPEASGAEGNGSAEGGDAGHPIEAGTTDGGACSGTLCACKNAGDCASHLCAVEVTVGSDLFSAAGGQFCTNACCTSANCSGGTVCFASGQGGNYCVDPKWLGRSPPGAGLGGASCASGSDCVSGLCTGAKLCADTCCTFPGSGECASPGLQCAFGDFPGAVGFDTHFTGHCGTPGGNGAYGDPCSGNNQCAGGLCFQGGGGGNCTQPCASSSQCGTGACQLDYQNSDLYFACFPPYGTGDQGANCSTDDQCLGEWCGTGSQCTNVCLNNSACTVVGWQCLPQSDMLPMGTYNVLACEAP
jgi:hypothetical protein